MRRRFCAGSIEIAAQISKDYRDRELTVIAVLNGSLIFMADLMRRIPLPLKLDCLSVASYHGKAQTSGEVIFKQVALPDVEDRHVLILDDILDSGHTLAAIREKLETGGAAQHPSLCLAEQKENARATRSMPITSASKSKTNSWSVTGSITMSAIAICPVSEFCGRIDRASDE